MPALKAQVQQNATTSRARRGNWFKAGFAKVDALVLGGGAVGACAFNHLARSGLQTLLIDSADFASGSSQGSAGLVWGGLLYLQAGHLGEVISWCRERNRLLKEQSGTVEPHRCRYHIDAKRRHPFLVGAALQLYWALGGFRGRRPHHDGIGLAFSEGKLTCPDARFTWNWIASTPAASTALNYCAAESIRWAGGCWRVQLRDVLNGAMCELRADRIVNAGGPWAGGINLQAGIRTDWELKLSRGTSLVVPGRALDQTTLFEHPDLNDVMSLVPFGSAAIWGSTEVLVKSPEEGFAVPACEVADLMSSHRRLIGALDGDEVIAVRCGVRAFAVRRGSRLQPSQAFGRAFRIIADRQRPWVSVFGGKLSGCAAAARQIGRHFGLAKSTGALLVSTPPPVFFPSLPIPVADPAFCRDHEQCWSLSDYLRRRTPIAQMVHRGGLGREGEHRVELARIAGILAHGDGEKARRDLDQYETCVKNGHDALLKDL